jgi:hypothetical protein
MRLLGYYGRLIYVSVDQFQYHSFILPQIHKSHTLQLPSVQYPYNSNKLDSS